MQSARQVCNACCRQPVLGENTDAARRRRP